MIDQTILEQLLQTFQAPLSAGEPRRIVFWHDVSGSFSDDFDELVESGAMESERPVSLARAEDGAMFELKRRILRTERDRDFLVYTRGPKDFSEGGLVGNWLSDVEICAEHFQADKVSLLLDGLNATADAAAPAIAEFEPFFNAESRREQYLKRMPSSSSRGDVLRGVLAVLLKSPDSSFGGIVSTYLCAMARGEDGNLRDQLDKHGATEAFRALLAGCIGYTGDIADKVSISSHLLISAASCMIPANSIKGLEGRISAPHAQFCLGMVRDWMNGSADRDGLYSLTRLVERELNLLERFSGMDAADIVDCDVFPCVNEALLVGAFAQLAKGEDASAGAIATARRRKDLKWYKRVSCWYDALRAAADVERFRRAHAGGFHEVSASAAWNAYREDWCDADEAYRAFCAACDRCALSTEDVPDPLRDGLDALAERVEGVYANWFLPQANACWVNCCEEAWAKDGRAAGIPHQRSFYDDYVAKNSDGAKRTLVIVSDALRYEVAREIAGRMERESKGVVELHAQQSVFPSVTEFGMAALLPHSTMQYDWDTGLVFADGMKTLSTADRERALKARKPASVAIASDKLMSGNRAARKELVGDAGVVYVYHDKIDSTGEKPKLERGVFKACAEAVDDVLALVRIAVNDLRISRVVVTADHGFLYTRRTLAEQDKIGKADIGAEGLQLHKRYVLSSSDFETSVLVKMNMQGLDGGDFYGFAPRECMRIKKPGGTQYYVHGGVSLQEMCVPVIVLRNKRIGAKGYASQEKAEIAVVSTSRRITSTMFHVDLFQREAVGGKVVPAEYELMLTDASGNPVTDVQKAHADMATADERARVSRPMFTLKAGLDYRRDADYYLVCRDVESGEIAWKKTYQVDMAFAPMVDFGF